MFSRFFGRSTKTADTSAATASSVERVASTGNATASSSHNQNNFATPDAGNRRVTPSEPTNAEALSNQIDILEKRQHVLEVKIQKEVEKAKEYLEKKNKTGATQCLQRKKIYEGQLTKLQAQLMNIERIRLAVEENLMNVEVMKAQRIAASDLKRLQQGMSPEDVDQDMDELRDLMDKTAEVSEALANDLGQEVADEDELESELAQLQQDAINEKMMRTGTHAAMKAPVVGARTPSGPVHATTNATKASASTKVDDALALELAALSVPKSNIGTAHTEEDEAEELAALERELNS